MIKTNVTDSNLYLGQNAGDDIYKSIKNAKKSIEILSPYISHQYIDLLVDAAERGVQVLLLSGTDMAHKVPLKKIYQKIILQKCHLDEKAKNIRNKGRIISFSLIAALFALNFISYKFATYTNYWSLLSLFILYPLFLYFKNKRIYSYSYNTMFDFCLLVSPYDLKIDNDHFFIHSKVYVIDNEVSYVGSVNFTKKAFRHNYECCVKITDTNAISIITEELKSLQFTEGLFYKDINQIGEVIYPEPAN